jgi:aminopeptidase I
MIERGWKHRETQPDSPSRHSIAAPYPNLIDVDDDYPAPSEHQNPPPVPPKIPEVKKKPEALRSASSRGPPAAVRSKEDPARYTKPFTDYMTNNPTIFHAVDAVAKDLEKDGYKKLSERDTWDIKAGGKYYVERNGTSLIAFAIGDGYSSGNGAAIVAGHIDALTAKLKPIPKLRTKAGYVQLGVAPYAGALSDTWWDRDLGVGGRVLVKEHGKIVTKLVKWTGLSRGSQRLHRTLVLLRWAHSTRRRRWYPSLVSTTVTLARHRRRRRETGKLVCWAERAVLLLLSLRGS